MPQTDGMENTSQKLVVVDAAFVGELAQRVAKLVLGELQKNPAPLSRLEAAKRLGVDPRTVDRRIAQGLLRAERDGGRVVIPRAEIERYESTRGAA